MPNKVTVSYFDNKTPSISELKTFGISFSKEQWELLCENKDFMDSLLENPILDTDKIARSILG